MASLPEADRITVERAIRALPDGDTARLKRELKHLRRLKVEDWRVFYLEDRRRKRITIVRVAHRSIAYE